MVKSKKGPKAVKGRKAVVNRPPRLTDPAEPLKALRVKIGEGGLFATALKAGLKGKTKSLTDTSHKILHYIAVTRSVDESDLVCMILNRYLRLVNNTELEFLLGGGH